MYRLQQWLDELDLGKRASFDPNFALFSQLFVLIDSKLQARTFLLTVIFFGGGGMYCGMFFSWG